MAFDISSLSGSTWLADPGYLRQAVARLAAFDKCFDARTVAKERRKRLDYAKAAPTRAKPRASGGGGVGGFAILGPIEQRLSPGLLKLGGTALEEVGASLDALLADRGVSTIILEFDSPGGSSNFVQEMSDRIYAARQKKPIIAVANSLCASAALWLATAATSFYVTPSGSTGSLGVYCLHIDESKALENDGITVSVVSAGRFKTEYMPFAPLSQDARDNLQADVDSTYQAFTAGVARNRNKTRATVLRDFGEGRLLDAATAKRVGMSDGTKTFDDVVRGALGLRPGDGYSDTPRQSALSATQRRLAAKLERDAERLRVRAKLDHADEVLAQAEARQRERMERFGRM